MILAIALKDYYPRRDTKLHKEKEKNFVPHCVPSWTEIEGDKH